MDGGGKQKEKGMTKNCAGLNSAERHEELQGFIGSLLGALPHAPTSRIPNLPHKAKRFACAGRVIPLGLQLLPPLYPEGQGLQEQPIYQTGIFCLLRKTIPAYYQCMIDKPRPRKNRVELTDKIRDTICEEMTRTALTDIALIKLIDKENAVGLTTAVFKKWLNGYSAFAKQGQLSTVLVTLKNYPDGYGNTKEVHDKLGLKRRKFPAEQIAVKEFLPELQKEMERTELMPTAIMRIIGDAAPPGLKRETITRWINENTDYADKAHVECVLHLLRTIP